MLKSKKLFVGIGLMTVISIILRTMIIVNNTDVSGLYIDRLSGLVGLLKIICVVVTVMALIVPMIDKMPEENRVRNRDKMLGISMIVFSGVMMFIGLVDFFNIYQLVWSTNFAEMQYLLLHTPNSIVKILFSVLSFVTGWVCMTLSMKVLNKVPVNNSYSLSLWLMLWTAVRAMLFSRSNNTITAIADNLYSMIAIIFAISFLLGFSKILFDENCKSGYKMMISSGLICIFYGLMATVPNYIAFFMGKNLFFSVKDTNGVGNLLVAFFAVAILSIIFYSDGENTSMFERENRQ